MRYLTAATMAGLLAVTAVADASPSQGKGKKHGRQEAVAPAVDRSDNRVAVSVVFGPRDVEIVRRHYEPQYRNLPPGLRKKVARGKPLPPGWRKKLEPFPVALERQLPRLPDGHRRGVIDGHAVIYNSRNQVVLDVAVLF